MPFIFAVIEAMRLVGRHTASEPARFPVGPATAWTFTIVAIIVVGLTVHFWGQILLTFMFVLGLWGVLADTKTRQSASI